MSAQVVVVTGASSGIGREVALAFARRGATVVAVARREERLQALLAELTPDSFYLCGDLGERAFAESVIEQTLARTGRIDVLINNAGQPLHKPIYSVSVEEAERVMQVNFMSALWCSFAAIPPMLAQGGGSIVNVSSFVTKVAPTYETIYTASKGAMNGLTEGLWQDLRGSGIHVAAIYPGPFSTEIWDRFDQPLAYKGKMYPPALVAEAVLECIDKKRYEMVLPKYNLMLFAARIMRRICPAFVRWGTAKMESVPPDRVAAARAAAQRGERMGSL